MSRSTVSSLETLRAATRHLKNDRERTYAQEQLWRRLILEAHEARKPKAQIARAAGVTRQRVWQIVNEEEEQK